ncbi:MAG: S8 family serine peptidase [Pirellulales bacterium]
MLLKASKRRTSSSLRQTGARRKFSFETLENRLLMAAFNDPDYATIQWGLNNTGQTGGLYDIDIDAPEAWAITTGSMKTVLALVDDGVDVTHADVYLNIWLNQDEIPASVRASLTDTDGDTILTFRDLNSPANQAFASDLNSTGYIDGGDLLLDARWANAVDDDGNGKVDDLVGWDFLDGDNDPRATGGPGHGTGMVQWMGGIPNNGIGKVGVNHFISVMPLRVRQGDVATVDPAKQAVGIDYAVAENAAISAVWGRSTTLNQELYNAVERARIAGHLVVAPAGNDSSNIDVAPQYPAALDLDNVIAVTSFNANDGKDAVWNWGATSVDLASPTAPGGGTSGGAAHVAGVAALLKSVHPDWNYQELKDRILSTVEPSAAFAGLTVTGGRLNAARTLAATSISISDPTVIEGDFGTTSLTFSVTRFGDSASEVVINWSTADETALAGSDYVASNGQIVFAAGGSNSETVVVDVIGDLVGEANETFYVRLSLVSGTALLADTDGQATVHDNEGTKFYVVNDATQNQTYEYDPNGALIESYSLDSGNSAPRGAASTVAGDKTWVLDANKRVYVYSDRGALLGSWSAHSSLAANAIVEGIATDGTDVWIVEAKSDRVYRYPGAASRLSGIHNATSSFPLNRNNRNAKDIVTDGTHLWVVDNSSTDKVLKYTLTGSLVGSWTISSGGGSPTGITIDPSNVSDIWIVDNVSDRVYQFTAAASRTSGSQSPFTSFALAAGNTNPQGIADPPAAAAETAAVATTHISATRARAVSRLDAVDLLFSQDDDSLSRRARRVSRVLNALSAS